jgi:hypothetical protein
MGFSKQNFEMAMASLFARRAIVVENYGRKGDLRERLARAR